MLNTVAQDETDPVLYPAQMHLHLESRIKQIP